MFDSCPPGPPAIPSGCTTPKLSLHGAVFASGNPSNGGAPGLAEDAEIVATASRPDPNNGGAVQIFAATTEPVLHIDGLTGRPCVISKHLRVWTSQNTIAADQQGDWTEIGVPSQLSLPDLPGVTDHWISDPGLAVDSAGFVYLSAIRADAEQDCTTNNSINDFQATRILLYVARPGATAFEEPIEVTTETTGVDHPEIAADPLVAGHIALTYWHTPPSVDSSSDRLVTLQRIPGQTTFETDSQGNNFIGRCFIERTGCSPVDDNAGNSFTGPRVAFSDAGALFLTFLPLNAGTLELQRLAWNPTSRNWDTQATGQISAPTPPSTATIVQAKELDFHATIIGGMVNLSADPTPALAVGNVAANGDPIVYVAFETEPTFPGTGFVDDRQVQIAAVNGNSSLAASNWHAFPPIPHAFHPSLSMSGPGNVVDAVFMQPLQIPTTSTSTQIQTFVQRIDASRLTAVGAPLALDANPPTLDSLPARHGEGSVLFTPGSLFVGEYEGIATLGTGFAVGAPGLALSSNGSDTVQALLNVGSQKCDPPSTIAINRPDAFWQCDNCDCGTDGAHDAVGCIPGSVTDAATICATLCRGTVCGRSLSCAHAVCNAPTTGASATLLAANSCNTHDGPYLGSEPSLFGDYIAGDDGTSVVTLAKASHVFTTSAPGTVAFNLAESPAGAGREIEIARIDLRPDNFDTGGFKIGPITIEPPHHIHDLRLVHAERVYGVFSDATHFQIPVGAADFFAVGFDGTTASQQFESNTSPLNGTFDPVAGTFTLDLVIGDPTTDGAEATFHGTISKKPTYDCAAGIAPVFGPLSTITVEPCYAGATVSIPLPRVTDLCTPHDILITGDVISINGAPVMPIPLKNDLVTLKESDIVVLWTATDANGTSSTAYQTIHVRPRPALFANGILEIDDDAIIDAPGGSGAIDNGGANGRTDVHHGAHAGTILSVPSVKLLGATIDGGVDSTGDVQNVGATVLGLIAAHTTLQLPVMPTIADSFPATSNGDINVSGTTWVAPGSYGALTVGGGATVKLVAGTYFFQTIHVSGTVHVDTSAGPVHLIVAASAFYDGATLTDDPSRFLVGYLGTQPFQVHGPFAGAIIAPNGALDLGLPKTELQGAFFAKNIRVNQGVHITQSLFACTLP